jgi:hypothetical protein
MGWIIGRHGFGAAFGTAAVLAALSLPYFVIADRVVRRRRGGGYGRNGNGGDGGNGFGGDGENGSNSHGVTK